MLQTQYPQPGFDRRFSQYASQPVMSSARSQQGPQYDHSSASGGYNAHSSSAADAFNRPARFQGPPRAPFTPRSQPNPSTALAPSSRQVPFGHQLPPTGPKAQRRSAYRHVQRSPHVQTQTSNWCPAQAEAQQSLHTSTMGTYGPLTKESLPVSINSYRQPPIHHSSLPSTLDPTYVTEQATTPAAVPVSAIRPGSLVISPEGAKYVLVPVADAPARSMSLQHQPPSRHQPMQPSYSLPTQPSWDSQTHTRVPNYAQPFSNRGAMQRTQPSDPIHSIDLASRGLGGGSSAEDMISGIIYNKMTDTCTLDIPLRALGKPVKDHRITSLFCGLVEHVSSASGHGAAMPDAVRSYLETNARGQTYPRIQGWRIFARPQPDGLLMDKDTEGCSLTCWGKRSAIEIRLSRPHANPETWTKPSCDHFRLHVGADLSATLQNYIMSTGHALRNGLVYFDPCGPPRTRNSAHPAEPVIVNGSDAIAERLSPSDAKWCVTWWDTEGTARAKTLKVNHTTLSSGGVPADQFLRFGAELSEKLSEITTLKDAQDRFRDTLELWQSSKRPQDPDFSGNGNWHLQNLDSHFAEEKAVLCCDRDKDSITASFCQDGRVFFTSVPHAEQTSSGKTHRPVGPIPPPDGARMLTLDLGNRSNARHQFRSFLSRSMASLGIPEDDCPGLLFHMPIKSCIS